MPVRMSTRSFLTILPSRTGGTTMKRTLSNPTPSELYPLSASIRVWAPRGYDFSLLVSLDALIFDEPRCHFTAFQQPFAVSVTSHHSCPAHALQSTTFALLRDPNGRMVDTGSHSEAPQ